MNRKEAGEQLAGRLTAFANRSDVIVLSLVPGGVPIGFEISSHLHLHFDIFPFVKFYSPYNQDYAFGASSLDDVTYIDKDLAKRLDVQEARIKSLKLEAKVILENYNFIYRNSKKMIDLESKIVIIVDDGACSEDDIYFAAKLIDLQDPKSLIIASPIISFNFLDKFENEIENIVCIAEIDKEDSIKNFYQDLSNVTDDEVHLLLERINYQKLVH